MNGAYSCFEKTTLKFQINGGALINKGVGQKSENECMGGQNKRNGPNLSNGRK